MNKSLKAKNLPLFSIIDLDQLRREKHLEGTEVTDNMLTAITIITTKIPIYLIIFSNTHFSSN